MHPGAKTSSMVSTVFGSADWAATAGSLSFDWYARLLKPSAYVAYNITSSDGLRLTDTLRVTSEQESAVLAGAGYQRVRGMPLGRPYRLNAESMA